MAMRDPRRPVAFALLVLVAFIVARFAGVAVHEVLGHGAFAALAGGAFYGVYVSPVTGFALVFVPLGAHDGVRVLVALAGILVELVAGFLLFAAYPRVRTFVGRLFALVLLQVLLVYSLAYLGLGAYGFAAGDPAQAAALVDLPHLAPAFSVVGLLWAFGVATLLSREVVRLVAPRAASRRQIGYVLLYWLVPLPVAAVPNAVLTLLAPLSLLMYALLVAVLAGTLAFTSLRMSSAAAPPMERSVGPLAPLVVAFLLVLPAWAAFGLTGETAENLLLSAPPLEAERLWANPHAINVRVALAADLAAALEFRFKGVPDLGSPLERRAFASYEDRADLAFWASEARFLAIVMTNATMWNVSSAGIDRAGTAWFDGQALKNPRLVVLAREGNASRFLVVSDVAGPNGTQRLLTLNVSNPFGEKAPVPCGTCFLDEVNLTWPVAPGRFRLVRVDAEGGDPIVERGTVVPTGVEFARFRVRATANAPRSYVLVLEILP